MGKIIFIDNRKSIVDKVSAIGITSICGDYFQEITKIPNHVICSASNPNFTFGGGFDLALNEHFPLYCYEKKKRSYIGNERIGNVCFVITVDDRINANKELVKEALQFATANTLPYETLCVMGLGTAIGRLSEVDFVEILKEVLNNI